MTPGSRGAAARRRRPASVCRAPPRGRARAPDARATAADARDVRRPARRPTPTADARRRFPPGPTLPDGDRQLEDVAHGPRRAVGARVPARTARRVVTLRDAAQLVLVGPDGAATRRDRPGRRRSSRDIVVPGGEGGLLGVAVARCGGQGRLVDLALYATAADDNRVLRGTLDGSTAGRPAAGPHRHPEGGQPQRRPARRRPGRLPLRRHRRRRATRPPRRTRTASAARSCGSRPTATPRPGNPDEGSPVWSLGHRNVQGLGWAPDGRMFASRVRPEHLGRAQPDRAGRQLRLAGGRGRRRRRGFVDPWPSGRPTTRRRAGWPSPTRPSTWPGCAGERLWRVPLDRRRRRHPARPLLDGRARPAARGRAGARTGRCGWSRGTPTAAATPAPGDDRILRVVVD